MKAPQHLKHKPIISVNDYDLVDAQYSKKTDVKALSIGSAQYDVDQVSLKIWRKPNLKWSRQSEEIPLHRNIDLNILLIGSLLSDINSEYPKTILREEILDKNSVSKIKDYYKQNEHFLKPRLQELQSKLNEFLK